MSKFGCLVIMVALWGPTCSLGTKFIQYWLLKTRATRPTPWTKLKQLSIAATSSVGLVHAYRFWPNHGDVSCSPCCGVQLTKPQGAQTHNRLMKKLLLVLTEMWISAVTSKSGACGMLYKFYTSASSSSISNIWNLYFCFFSHGILSPIKSCTCLQFVNR